ncbi:class I histocompatibility antigen, Gogo-B*0201 alpha chain-like [Discoglossus pictus]
MGRYIFSYIVLTLLPAQLTFAGSHSHYFVTTVTNTSSSVLPLYFTTRELDDVTLFWYDSNNQLMEIREPWFKVHNKSYGRQNLYEMVYQDMMQKKFWTITSYLNETGEVHYLQRLEGCTLYDDGTSDITWTDAYDGKPFLTFDVGLGNWTAEVPEAESFLDALNANQTINEMNMNTFLNTCVSHISELLDLGKETLNRIVEPIVRVTTIPTEHDFLILNCRAYGHYPKEIYMIWERNGHEVPETELQHLTLPLPDQNFLSSVSVIVSPMEIDSYNCKVTHSSLETPLTMTWKSSVHSQPQVRGLSTGAVIAICLAVTLLVTLIVFSIVAWSKSRQFKETS